MLRDVLHNRVAFLAALLAVASNGALAQGPETYSSNKIFDSGINVLAGHSSPQRLRWINDDEVLFVGQNFFSDPVRIEYRIGKWNVRTGQETTIKQFGSERPTLCYHDGYVLIRIGRDEGARAYHGKLDAIVEDRSKQDYNLLLCRPTGSLPKLPSWARDRDARWVQSVDVGFIDFGERKNLLENTPARLYRHNAKQDDGITLPFGRREVIGPFAYYPFKKAFFLESSYHQWPRPKGIPYPLYWLYRDGKVEQVADVPWGPWRSGGSSWFEPTRAGVTIATSNFNVRDRSDLANAGLYMLAGNEVSRLLKAWIRDISVSPNGCRLAFDWAATVTRSNNVLKVMELCQGN